MEAMKEQLSPGADRPWDDSPASWRRLFRELGEDRSGSLEELYDAASSRLYGLALWRTGSIEDARDVVQDAFVRVVEHRNRLRRIRDPRAWLLTVTHRIAVDVVRRRKRRSAESLDDCPYLVAPAADADRALDAGRASALVDRLPGTQREVIYLHQFAGCTFATIGRILGVPTFTAASRYRLGLRKLRSLMEARP